ncbi:uncharacterized protein LOC135369228 isoform X2 [Ornithodoros turicata]|uniref:uncharacterized protein LOC135369228 isoform X2 n=1 Tax=Ornithodoros turicata TaxID=34597 RepID=UPI003139BABE
MALDRLLDVEGFETCERQAEDIGASSPFHIFAWLWISLDWKMSRVVLFLFLFEAATITRTQDGKQRLQEPADSRMYTWRPYQFYVVGDSSIPEMAGNKAVPYAQRLLNRIMLGIRSNKRNGCVPRLKVLGAKQLSEEEEKKYLPKTTTQNSWPCLQVKDDVDVRNLMDIHPHGKAADIVLVLTRHAFSGNYDAVTYGDEEKTMCTDSKAILLKLASYYFHAFPNNVVVKILKKEALSGKEDYVCYNTGSSRCKPVTYDVHENGDFPPCDTHFQWCVDQPQVAGPRTTMVGNCTIECLNENGLNYTKTLPDGVHCSDNMVCMSSQCNMGHDEMLKSQASDWDDEALNDC